MSSKTANFVMACPQCGKRMRIPGKVAGKRARCPGCGETFAAAPEASATAAPPPAPEKVTFPCDACGGNIRARTALEGKRVKCPKCGTATIVPPTEAGDGSDGAGVADDPFGLDALAAAEQSAVSAESREAQLARMKAAAAARVEESSASTPRKALSPSGPKSSWRIGDFAGNFVRAYTHRGIMTYVCCVLLFLGGFGIYAGIQEFQIRARSAVEPQQLTCEELGRQGPGDNLHVRMSDFDFLPAYVYQQDFGRWRGAWAPAVPLGEVERSLAQYLKIDPAELVNQTEERIAEAYFAICWSCSPFKIIVAMPNADGEEYVERVQFMDEIQGVVLNDFQSLDRDTKKLLREEYKNANVEACWILVEGRKPRTAAQAQGYIAGGTAGILASLLIAAYRAKSGIG